MHRLSPVGWTGGDDLAEEQRGRPRPPGPLLGGQRDHRAAADVALQKVDQLFVRATVESLDQQNTRTLSRSMTLDKLTADDPRQSRSSSWRSQNENKSSRWSSQLSQ